MNALPSMLQDFLTYFQTLWFTFQKNDITQNTYWKKHTVLKKKKWHRNQGTSTQKWLPLL